MLLTQVLFNPASCRRKQYPGCKQPSQSIHLKCLQQENKEQTEGQTESSPELPGDDFRQNTVLEMCTEGSWQIGSHTAVIWKPHHTDLSPDLLESSGHFMKSILVPGMYVTCRGVSALLEDFIHVQSLVDSGPIQVRYWKEVNLSTQSICFPRLSIQGSSRRWDKPVKPPTNLLAASESISTCFIASFPKVGAQNQTRHSRHSQVSNNYGEAIIF